MVILGRVRNTAGWNNPATPTAQFTGNLTITAVDVSSPHAAVLQSTLIPSPAVPTGGAYSVVGIGNGRFAISVGAPPQPAPSGAVISPPPPVLGLIGIVDATDPKNLVFASAAAVLNPGELGFTNGLLLVTGGNGLNVFKVN